MEDNNYKFPPVEKVINWIISFIFYYRLVFVLIAILGIGFLARKVYLNSENVDRLKNVAVVLTGGSIIIGIFYSIINYEHNQAKFKYDKKSTRDTLTFTTACRMHEADTISHFKNIKQLYLNNKTLFLEGKHPEIIDILAGDEPVRISFIVIFNYLESIGIGIDQGIMDESFMKKFFKSLFRDYNGYFGTHFEYLRRENHSPDLFLNFTKLANKWTHEI